MASTTATYTQGNIEDFVRALREVFPDAKLGRCRCRAGHVTVTTSQDNFYEFSPGQTVTVDESGTVSVS